LDAGLTMESLVRALAADDVDVDALLGAIPYCRHIGVKGRREGATLVLFLPFQGHLIGNPMIPALHGGVIGSLLETAALAQVIFETKTAKLPRPVDMAIDYLRTGRARDSFARARIAKQGRRVINVQAEMWQDDPEKPIATLRGHVLVD
jgi:uncharacterized protein (TIGR00369 family)